MVRDYSFAIVLAFTLGCNFVTEKSEVAIPFTEFLVAQEQNEGQEDQLQVVFARQPSTDQYEGTPFSVQPVIEIQDENGLRVPLTAVANLHAFLDPQCSQYAPGLFGNTLIVEDGTATGEDMGFTGSGVIYILASVNGIGTACSEAVEIESPPELDQHIVFLDPDPLNLGYHRSAYDFELTVKNIGTGPSYPLRTVHAATLLWELTQDGCSGISLSPEQTCTLGMSFRADLATSPEISHTQVTVVAPNENDNENEETNEETNEHSYDQIDIYAGVDPIWQGLVQHPGTVRGFERGSDTSLYVVGQSRVQPGVSPGSFGGHITRFGPNGNLMWRRIVTTTDSFNPATGELTALTLTPNAMVAVGYSGGNVVPGETYSRDNPYTDIVVAKYSYAGARAWIRQYGINSALTAISSDGDRALAYDKAWAVAQDDSGIYVAGEVEKDGDRPDAFVMKLSHQDGSIVWQQILEAQPAGHATHDHAFFKTLHRGEDGKIYAAGYTKGRLPGQTQTGDCDGIVSRVNAQSGTFEAIHQFGSDECETVQSITEQNGRIYISGRTDGNLGSPNYGGQGPFSWSDFFIAELSAVNLEPIRILQYGTAADESRARIRIREDGKIFLVSSTVGSFPNAQNPGEEQIVLAETDLELGMFSSVQSFGRERILDEPFVPGVWRFGGHSAVEDDLGNPIVAGTQYHDSNSEDPNIIIFKQYREIDPDEQGDNGGEEEEEQENEDDPEEN